MPGRHHCCQEQSGDAICCQNLFSQYRKKDTCVIHWDRPFPDRGLQKGLKQQVSDWPWKIRSIKSFRSYRDDYLPFIEHCRSLAKEESWLPIELNSIGVGPRTVTLAISTGMRVS